MDCTRTVLADPYRAPVAPRSALPGFTRIMTPRSIRQANKTGQHNGINEPRAADSKSHGPCGLRGLLQPTVIFARCTELRQRVPAQASSSVLEQSTDCRRMEHGKPCACVSPELTSSGEPCSFVAAERKNLAARRGQAIATYGTAKNFQILGMNLIYFATGPRKVLPASSPVIIIRSLMRISE
jgi:hypothetical protein